MSGVRFSIIVTSLVMLALPAQAQEHRVAVRVEAVAGENAYLDAGAERGIAAGDTLTAYRSGRLAGRLRVLSATASRSVVAFVGEAFPITRGERFDVILAAPQPATEEPVPDTTAVPLPGRRSIFEQPIPAPLPSAARRDPVRLTGRFQTGTTVLWSSTAPLDGSDARTRTFATPFLGLRGRVAGLPGDVRLNVNGRLTYRVRSDGDFDEPADLRLYQASAEKDLGLVRVEAGRLYNEYDRYSGYLDGVIVHVGSATAGGGATVGVEPGRANAGFSSDLPKYTVFGHYRLNPKPLRIDLRAVAGQILPKNDALTARTFLGFTHRTAGDGFSVSTDVLVDRDPATGDLAFSRFLARGTVEVTDGLRLRARYQQRRPYILFGDLQVLRDLSERVGGGVSYRLPGRALGGTVVRADLSSASAGDLPASLAYSGGLFVPRLPVGGLGLNAYASVWARDDRRSVYASAALSRSFGRVYGSLGYRYQQTPLLTESLVTHGVEGALQVPLLDGISATVQGSAQLGETISNVRLYTGLWWRL